MLADTKNENKALKEEIGRPNSLLKALPEEASRLKDPSKLPPEPAEEPKAAEKLNPSSPAQKEREAPKEPKHFIEDIIEAAMKSHTESLAFLLSKERSLVGKKDGSDLL
jgi:hypothetical protein